METVRKRHEGETTNSRQNQSLSRSFATGKKAAEEVDLVVTLDQPSMHSIENKELSVQIVEVLTC